MKINKGGPQVPVGGADEAGRADKTAAPKAGERAFAEKLDRAGPVATGGGAEKASGQGRFTGDIGKSLENKEITADAAVDQVMSRILDRQLGTGTPPRARAHVETALREALDSDPVLSAKLKGLAD